MNQNKELRQFLIFLLLGGGLVFAVTKIPIKAAEVKPSPAFLEVEFTIV
jgi:hypothetical protein